VVGFLYIKFKNMKNKISIFVLLVTILIPQVVSASWWNPLSWKIFNRENNKTQILENRMQELENKLQTATTSTKQSNLEATTSAIKKLEQKKTTPVVDNSTAIQAEVQKQVQATLKAKTDQEALIAKQKAEEQVKIEATQKAIHNDEQKTLFEESKKTTLNVGNISCTLRPAGEYYFLPFTVDGEWVSGWIQVKITDEYGRIITKGLDLDKSNIDDGFIFSQAGYSGSNTKLQADLKGTYQIKIYSVVPRYVSVSGGRVSPFYSTSGLVAEESGVFSLPDCW